MNRATTPTQPAYEPYSSVIEGVEHDVAPPVLRRLACRQYRGISVGLVEMKGYALAPTLFDGDILAVDRSLRTPVPGGMVVIETARSCLLIGWWSMDGSSLATGRPDVPPIDLRVLRGWVLWGTVKELVYRAVDPFSSSVRERSLKRDMIMRGVLRRRTRCSPGCRRAWRTCRLPQFQARLQTATRLVRLEQFTIVLGSHPQRAVCVPVSFHWRQRLSVS
jgi:hypothetical protein